MKERIERPSAQRIIDTIVSTMKKNVERFDVHYSLAPSIYLVFLHPEDYEKVRSFIPDIVEYAHNRLDWELQNMNQAWSPLEIDGNVQDNSQEASSQYLIRPAGNNEGFVKRAGSSWQVIIKPSLGVVSVKKGAVVVWPRLVSENAQASDMDKKLLSGDSTNRVMMILNDTGKLESHVLAENDSLPRGLMDAEIISDQTIQTGILPDALDFIPVKSDLGQITSLNSVPAIPEWSGPEKEFATLSYREEGENKIFKMVTKELAVGRKDESNQSYVQLQILTSTDVSREHFRIRFNKAEQSFEIKDVSRYGTWVNKERVASSFSTTDELPEGQDLENWHLLPHEATINLAGVLDIQFKSDAR